MLDALVRCSTIAFDKTGTLTTGALTCTSMLPVHHSTHQAPTSQASTGQSLLLCLAPPTPFEKTERQTSELPAVKLEQCEQSVKLDLLSIVKHEARSMPC